MNSHATYFLELNMITKELTKDEILERIQLQLLWQKAFSLNPIEHQEIELNLLTMAQGFIPADYAVVQ